MGAAGLGIGIDLLEVDRLERALDRRPRLAERLFSEHERAYAQARPRPARHLAARLCAKEAVAKALGAPGALRWHDAEVTVGDHGRPHLAIRGSVAGRAAQLGITSWHLSLSHDGGIASAVVVAEGSGRVGTSDREEQTS